MYGVVFQVPGKGILKLSIFILSLSAFGLIAGAGVGYFILWQGSKFDDLKILEDHEPVQFTKIYDRHYNLIDIISAEQRIVLDFEDIPEDFVNAIVALEDKSFFDHIGVSPMGILATIKDRILRDSTRGASTLTQQLVKNITKDKRRSYSRKLKEQFLAVQVELRLTKKEIFAQYSNLVSFGNNQFGIEAAARYYFGKTVGSLSLIECATLAGIPQAPSIFNPYRRPEACLKKRNLVLLRMKEEGYIDEATYQTSIKLPLELKDRRRNHQSKLANHFVDMIREDLFNRYGEDHVRTAGWDVHTTLDLDYQRTAEAAVHDGLQRIDKLLGYRPQDCPSVFHGDQKDSPEALDAYFDPTWHYSIQSGIGIRGLITQVAEDEITVRIDQHELVLTAENMPWINMRRRTMNEFFKVGDVPWFKVVEKESEEEEAAAEGDTADSKTSDDPADLENTAEILDPFAHLTLMLDQVPDIEGAFMAIDPLNGDLLAVVGSYEYARSKFNRATQAKRQVGSAFKPFVFGAALEQGYTLADTLFDEPTLFWDPAYYRLDRNGELESRLNEETERRIRLGLMERPKHYEPRNFYPHYAGAITLRDAIAQSKNIVSVKLLNAVGYDHVIEYAYRLNLGHNDLKPFPSLALGAMEMTLQDLVYSYGAFADKGIQYEPRTISLIMDKKGRIIERNPPKGHQAVSPQNAYLVTQALRAVIEDNKGSGRAARALRKPFAGKTGTTDDYADTWFVGFNPTIVAGAWVGRDLKERIGRNRTGGNTALPIWIDFMKGIEETLKGPDFEMPEGLIKVPIDKKTGTKMTRDCDCPLDGVIFQVFTQELEPTEICSMDTKKRAELPWYLQKRKYQYDPVTGIIEKGRVRINRASQLRAQRFIQRKAEEQRENSHIN